jgi:hypothetical protein
VKRGGPLTAQISTRVSLSGPFSLVCRPFVFCYCQRTKSHSKSSPYNNLSSSFSNHALRSDNERDKVEGIGEDELDVGEEDEEDVEVEENDGQYEEQAGGEEDDRTEEVDEVDEVAREAREQCADGRSREFVELFVFILTDRLTERLSVVRSIFSLRAKYSCVVTMDCPLRGFLSRGFLSRGFLSRGIAFHQNFFFGKSFFFRKKKLLV